MRYLKYLLLTFILFLPINAFAGLQSQSGAEAVTSDYSVNSGYAYYDLRNRSSYVQITNVENENICIHVQIWQQDKNCDEINFIDFLTPNDTVIYNLDNIIKNNGEAAPINLSDDSYGYVTITPDSLDSGTCGTPLNGALILGNSRIIDDTGYEYRMNLVGNTSPSPRLLNAVSAPDPPTPALANIIIPFNTVDGANQADIVAFILEDSRGFSGQAGTGTTVNEESGVTFSVFQIDENEERLSCDQKTFACGPGKVMNYGVNEDYPNSRGGPLLCEGAGLTEGQTNGYISLENASFLSNFTTGETFEFVCLVGLNNGNGTGSMDECIYKCVDDDGTPFDCSSN